MKTLVDNVRRLRGALGRAIGGSSAFQNGGDSTLPRNLRLFQEVVRSQYIGYQDSNTYSFLVFSKDRPLQLHALLSSMRTIGAITCPVYVIYRASNVKFREAYQEVLRNSKLGQGMIEGVDEDGKASFKENTLSLLKSMPNDRVGLLVDDIIFIRECNLSLFDVYDFRKFVPSLRLSKRITHSYMLSGSQSRPHLSPKGRFLTWSWAEGGIDWRYPLSLDGNILLKSELLPMIEYINFSSPNTLESGLQVFNPVYKDKSGLCFDESRLINIPCNRVQTDFDNRAGDVGVEQLLDRWRSGQRMRYEDFAGLTHNAVHAELPFRFVSR